MARPSKEYNLSTKTARLRLAVRRKPYYRNVGEGKSLGYFRRVSGPGAWEVRDRHGSGYKHRMLGEADDIRRADGREVLTYQQALAKAASPNLPAPAAGKITVAQAMKSYLSNLAARSAHAKEARQRAEKHILPELGAYRVDRLTTGQIEKWRTDLVAALVAASAKRRRAGPTPNEDQRKRQSQDTANRILNTLKAALNEAFKDESSGIASDAAWRRVKAFKGVAGSRSDHFDAEQVGKLIAEAAKVDQAFANLCEAGYLTGARYSELTGLEVRDFDAGRAILQIRGGKTGARPVTLSSEAVMFFLGLTEKRPATATLLPRADGDRWGKSEQFRPFRAAAAAAGFPPTASFYALRHSYISRAIEGGMPLSLVAENCGTSLAMIQRNYAKVLAKTRRETIEATAPKLRVVK